MSPKTRKPRPATAKAKADRSCLRNQLLTVSNLYTQLQSVGGLDSWKLLPKHSKLWFGGLFGLCLALTWSEGLEGSELVLFRIKGLG